MDDIYGIGLPTQQAIDEIMRIMSPRTPYERKETIAVLGEDTAFQLFGIRPDKLEQGPTDAECISAAELETFRMYKARSKKKSYNRWKQLDVYLLALRKEITDPDDWDLEKTIKFCFGELFCLFDTKFDKSTRLNFLSYGYFINRILELHNRTALRDRLGIKEPKMPRVRCNQDCLWQMFLAKNSD